jgi:hypothetical protein
MAGKVAPARIRLGRMCQRRAVWLILTQVGHRVRVGTSTAGLNAPTKRIPTLSREVKLRRSLRLSPVSPVSLAEARLPSDFWHAFDLSRSRLPLRRCARSACRIQVHKGHAHCPLLSQRLAASGLARATRSCSDNILNEIYHATLCAQMSQLWSIPTGENPTVCVVLLASGISASTTRMIEFVCNAFAPNRLPTA